MHNTVISIYSTSSGELLRTLRVDETLRFAPSPDIAWSDNSTLHVFHSYFFTPNDGEYWFTFNTNEGELLQSQRVESGIGCDDFGRIRLGVTHAGTQSLLYIDNPGSDSEVSYLCRLDLADYSRSSATLDFIVTDIVYQIISTDGSTTLFYEKDTVGSLPFLTTREFDTVTLQEARTPYPSSYGTIELITPDYSIVDRGIDYEFLPGEKLIDTSGGRFSASESGNVMALNTTFYSDDDGNETGGRGHIRFTALPSGIVIGDVPEDNNVLSINDSPRHISANGSIATVYDGTALQVYELSGRSQVSSFSP